MPSTVEVGLTSLHRPAKTTSPTADESPARVLAWANDYTDLLVTIPRNDKRTGQVAFSFDDPICELLYADAIDADTGHQIQVTTAYEVMLFVRWHAAGNTWPVLWAPIVDMDWRHDDRTVTVTAVDVQRLIDHQIHHGDVAYDAGHVPGNSVGIAALLQAADMTADQLNDGTPNHGINAASSGVGSVAADDMEIGVSLDDPLWDKIVEVTSYEGAVDIAVIPREVEDPSSFPYYADLTCYEEQGTNFFLDDGAGPIFEAGFGKDNAESMDWSPGGTYFTHAIVRDRDNKHRVPRANLDARRRTGAYVYVENIPSTSPSATLTSRAEGLVKQYSFPADTFSVVLKGDDPKLEALAESNSYVRFDYLQDFDLGDTVTCEVRDAYYHKRAQGQISEVRLRQESRQAVKQEIDVVPVLVDLTELGDDGVF